MLADGSLSLCFQFHAKVLGFTRFLFDVTSMERVHPSMAFQDFGGIRSTQPTITEISKIDSYGAFLKRILNSPTRK